MRHHTPQYAFLLPILFSLAAAPAIAQSPELVEEARPRDSRALSREMKKGYPIHYEQAGVGGTVHMKVFVTAAGKPDSVRVASSSGIAELDVAAAQTVRTAKFAPARGPDGPQSSWVDFAFTFGEPSAHASPRLVNRPIIEKAIQADHPSDLKEGGVYVDVVVLLTVDSAGQVVRRSAPYVGCFPSAARAALEATRHFAFEPAGEAVSGMQKAVVTVRFAEDSVRLTLRGDADPPPERRPPADSAAQKGRTRRPELKNASVVERALIAAYPRKLRDDGIGGEVIMWMYVNEEGRVTRRKVSRSSGMCGLDLAALQIAEVMRFSPALKDGESTAVWVEIPILFTSRSSSDSERMEHD